MHSAFCFGNVAGVKPGGIGIEYLSKLFEKPFDKLLWFINRLWSAFNQFEWEKFTCNRQRRRRRRKLNKKKQKQQKKRQNSKCTWSVKMCGCVHVLQWLNEWSHYSDSDEWGMNICSVKHRYGFGLIWKLVMIIIINYYLLIENLSFSWSIWIMERDRAISAKWCYHVSENTIRA